MALTEEQRQRMEANRKRALELKKKKQIEKEKNKKTADSDDGPSVFEAGGFVSGQSSETELQSKRRRVDDGLEGGGAGKEKGSAGGNANAHGAKLGSGSANKTTRDDDESSLEEFERDATPYISQTEAQRTYCVPMGTLEVCSYIEKDNPRRKGWNKMKLYSRAEVRRRARKRFGGKEGLVREREKRKQRRFEKDLAEMKDVFR